MAAWKLRDINGHQIYVVYPEKRRKRICRKKSELFSQNIALLFETGLNWFCL